MWGTDIVGVEEQDYRRDHANTHCDTFFDFLPAHAVLAKWCTSVARGPRNNDNNQYKCNPLTDVDAATMDTEEVEVIRGTKNGAR